MGVAKDPRSGAVARGSRVDDSPIPVGKTGKGGDRAPPHALKAADGLAVPVAALINEAGPVISVRYENGSVQLGNPVNCCYHALMKRAFRVHL